METPLQLEFHGVDASDDARALVAANLAKLERRYGRTTACRVVIGAGHHKTGEAFGVSVRIALPKRREVNVGHVQADDSRLADLSFAINDAFKRALRQLSDETDQLQGRIKRRAAQSPD